MKYIQGRADGGVGSIAFPPDIVKFARKLFKIKSCCRKVGHIIFRYLFSVKLVGQFVKCPLPGIPPGISDGGLTLPARGAKIWFSGYYKYQKSPKKSHFTFRRGLPCSEEGATALPWRHPCPLPNGKCLDRSLSIPQYQYLGLPCKNRGHCYD